ncbi:MAG: glycosyltransferase [Patescibacteria group bacterium]|nr:glycosyltransferase [Patescibacteria group bacterium]
MKVALVYDRVNKWGGAERVLLALREIFPKAPLYTSVYNSKKAPWADVFKVKTSFLQKFPKASSSHEYYAALMPHAFESFDFEKYDLVISVTSEAAKGIITKPKTLHICYCLTPTRYLWSGYDEYFKNTTKFLSKPVISYLRRWDKIASKRPDRFVAISKEVQGRIKKYYGRESIVVYPPVTLTGPVSLFPCPTSPDALPPAGARRGSPALATRHFKNKNDYFLIVSRLVPYKRIDIAIKAFNKLKIPLKIVGTGILSKKMKKLAGPTIEFLENLTDKELLSYYMGCKVLVFPGREDLGLSILEAQNFGKPVIAFKAGGALETVLNGKTGVFFYPQNEDALIKIVEKFDSLRFNPDDSIRQAQRFNMNRFKKEFTATVEKFLNKR